MFDLLLYAMQNNRVADIKPKRCYKPRDREGNVKRTGGSDRGKDGVDPNHAQCAGADKADEHRCGRGTESAEHSRHDLHKSAKEVEDRGVEHSLHSEFDDGLLVCRAVIRKEDAEKRLAECVCDKAERNSDDQNEQQAIIASLLDTLEIASAEILSREGERSVVKGVECDINESVDRGGGTVARNADLVK